MTVDTVAQALHLKSVSGGALTAEEQARLRQWYAKNDEEEAAMLAKSRQSTNQDALQAEIDETKARIVAEAQRIQVLEQENERLRGEIASLTRQIAKKMMRQSV